MSESREVILSAIAGGTEKERLLVVHCHCETTGSRVELRQQTWGEGIGWFTQTTLAVDPLQLAELRGVLGSAAPAKPAGYLPKTRRFASTGDRPQLRIARAESA